MSESTLTIRSIRSGRTSAEEQAAEHRAGKAPLAGERPVVGREVEGQKRDALAQAGREPLEAGRHVARLADEEDLVCDVRLGLDQRGDGAHGGREERTVRREAEGGAQEVPPNRRLCGNGLAGNGVPETDGMAVPGARRYAAE